EWVKSKLRLLRNSYTKAKRAPPSGSSRKNQTNRTVWILEKLQFLAPHIAERSSVSNIDTPSPTPTTDSDTPVDPLLDNSELEDSITLVEEDENEKGDLANSTKRPTATRPKSIKQKRDEEEYQLMKGLASSISTRYKKQNQAKQDSAVDAFGVYVTKTLSELNPSMRNMAQFQIHNILFQAQMGTISPSQHQTQTHTHQPMPPVTQQQMFAQQQQFYSPHAEWASQQQPLIHTGNSQMQGDYTTENPERMF
ncbi:Hypothetical predicted protein, partial [Paramuricea clavata]